MLTENTSGTVTTPPKVQKFERQQTIKKEHKDALERAVSLNIPHATSPEESCEEEESDPSPSVAASKAQTKSSGGKANWDEVVQKLFKKKSGELVLNTDATVPN